MASRRTFIQQGGLTLMGALLLPEVMAGRSETGVMMTVNGPVNMADLKFTLTHEHILVDFIGAAKQHKDRYNAEEVYRTALPFLQDVKDKGCATFVECTPAYLGRDVQLLRRLSTASGLHIITNTGYYGAAGEKYLPAHVYTETAEQLAARWIGEWTHGIEGTGIKPGFIKTGVDKAPLSTAQQKIIEAAALTHLATGLAIGVHTGNGAAADEQLEILKAKGVAPSARIWIHAQSEPDAAFHIATAKKGGWVSFDGVSPGNIQAYVKYLQTMKEEGLLDLVLVSQDAGWYNVGEPNGGNYRNYNCIFTDFIPALQQNGFTQKEIDTVFVSNPAKAFFIRNIKQKTAILSRK